MHSCDSESGWFATDVDSLQVQTCTYAGPAGGDVLPKYDDFDESSKVLNGLAPLVFVLISILFADLPL